MNIERSAGVLLHPTSLPGPYGIGDLGENAYAFVDWLEMAGCRFWQVLPLGPTGYGNSPYQCHSAFAGNPNLISPQMLQLEGLVLQSEIDLGAADSGRAAEGLGRVDYGTVIPWKHRVVKAAAASFETRAAARLRSEFETFKHMNSHWLTEFALFMALKSRYRGAAFTDWPLELRSPSPPGQDADDLRAEIETWVFGQWIFFRQWAQLRDHARRRGVKIIGDAPIFAAMDSADVWAHPDLFCLDERRAPKAVAGVPPDYFAPTGQLWGNPLYDWRRHRDTGYEWWIRRAKSLLRLVDLVRLDHFRGFAGYWQIPGAARTAESGEWAPGPAEDFLDALVRAVDVTPQSPDLPLIAEDLGVGSPDVGRLLDAYDLPGMRVLQFAFAGFQEEFLPHNYPEPCVAYTGTHDNDTSHGWYTSAPEPERRDALKYLGCSEEGIVWAMIRAIWQSRAALAIAPVQDILDLGTEARMNFPGKPQGYWEWRLPEGALTESLARELRLLNAECMRLVPDQSLNSD